MGAPSWLDSRERLIESDDILFGLLSALIIYFSKASALSIPYFRDEILYYVNPIRILYEQGFGNMVWDGSFFNYPFGLALLILPFQKLFGHSVWLLRFIALFCVWGSVFFTYKIGKIVHGKILGFCGAISFFALPIIFTQSTMILGDTFFILFTTFFFFLLIQKKHFWSLLFIGLIMGFVRETAFLFVPVSAFFYWWQKKIDLRSLSIIFSPTLGVVYFFLISGFSYHALLEVPDEMIQSIRYAFFEDYKDILLYPALFLGVFLLLFPQLREKKGMALFHLILLFLPLFFFAVFFPFDKSALDRYFNPVLPFFTLLCFYPIVRFSRFVALLFALVLCLRLPQYSYRTNPFKLGIVYETTMKNREGLKVQIEAAKYRGRNL